MLFKFIITFCFILPFCKSIALLDKQTKCNLNDNSCHIKVLQNIINELTNAGVPEYNIPKIDPYVLKNLEMNILGMVNVVLVEGIAEGIKTCKITGFEMKTDVKQISMDITCDRFKIAGSYKLNTLPAFNALLSDIKIHGDGSGSLDIDKIHFNLILPFEFKKTSDGEIHLHVKTEDASMHTIEVINKAVFAGNNLYIGSVDISEVTIAIFNENWQFVTKSFSQMFFNRVLDIILQHVSSVLEAVPAKEFIADDVSQYL